MTLERARAVALSGRAARRGRHSPGAAVCPSAHVASCIGRSRTSIGAMKKLLLLLVIAALATIATKKVRAAS